MRGRDWLEDRTRGHRVKLRQRADIVGMLLRRNRGEELQAIRGEMGPLQSGATACGVVGVRSAMYAGPWAHADFVVPPGKRGAAASCQQEAAYRQSPKMEKFCQQHGASRIAAAESPVIVVSPPDHSQAARARVSAVSVASSGASTIVAMS